MWHFHILMCVEKNGVLSYEVIIFEFFNKSIKKSSNINEKINEKSLRE